MLSFFAIQKLFPKSKTFTFGADKVLTKYLRGIASGLTEPFLEYAQQIFQDLKPDTTQEIDKWRSQFGLFDSQDQEFLRAGISGAWRSAGGQGIDYFQQVINAAGFNITVHSSIDPITGLYRNPLDYFAQDQAIGLYFCNDADQALCGDPRVLCSDLQKSIQDYIVDLDFRQRVQPPIINDPDTFPFWIYVGGEVFGERALVSASRQLEFQSLILSLFPGNYWIGYFVDPVSDHIITDFGGFIETDGSGFISIS